MKEKTVFGWVAPVIFCSFYLFGTVIGNYLTLIGKGTTSRGSLAGSGRYVRDRP